MDDPSLPPNYRRIEEPPPAVPRNGGANAEDGVPVAERPRRKVKGKGKAKRKTQPGPPRPSRRLLVIAALSLAVPGAYLAYRVATPGVEAASVEGPLPPLVPLQPVGEAREGLTPVVGPDLSGPAGSSVLLAVRAGGPGGLPLADTVVRFEVLIGRGTLASPMIRTDGEGLAAVSLELPAASGATLVSAEIEGSSLPPVRFNVTAVTGLPERIEVAGGNGQAVEAGGLLPDRMAVRVSDDAGNPVVGTEVLFRVLSGGGIVGPTRLRTDSLGLASARWRLGFTSGAQRLMAAAVDGGASVTFTATARGGVPATAGDGSAGPGAGGGRAERPPPETAGGPVTVTRASFAVGGSHVCAIDGGRAVCRGANSRGQASGTDTGGSAAVATGTTHACALDASGVASCWGANESGQLGDGSRTDRATPVEVATDFRFSSLTAGTSHTCGLAAGGTAMCWGQNLSGQLGDGSRSDRTTPRAVAGDHRFVTLVAGWNHTCGVTAALEAYCWGLNAEGQLGDGSRLDRLVPTRVPGRFTALAAGTSHTCGINGNEVMCWGGNRFGQLGDGTTESRPAAVTVQGLPGPPRQLAAGAVHTCALLTDGSAHCWGQNLHGQLGDGSTRNQPMPSGVGGSLRFASIYAGGALTCGFTEAGAQYCWGLNQSGQLGDGTRVSRPLPTRVGG